jgi:hypothetical protein
MDLPKIILFLAQVQFEQCLIYISPIKSSSLD